MAIVQTITAYTPDILILQGIDYDHQNVAARAFSQLLNQNGHPLPYVLMPPTNTGVPTGLDMDGDRKFGTPRDAQGYGRFFGHGSVAILSKFPIQIEQVQSFHDVLWSAVTLPENLTELIPTDSLDVQRLASTVMAAVPVQVADRTLWVLTHHATPPVFDGPEDRNGHRNAAENLFWLGALSGQHAAQIGSNFIIAGQLNADPQLGQGRKADLIRLITDSRLQNPFADWPATDRHTVTYQTAGPLRVSELLPSANLRVTGLGMSDDPPISDKIKHTRHRLLWIDVEIPN